MSVYLWAWGLETWDPGSVEKFKCYLCGEILCSGLIHLADAVRIVMALRWSCLLGWYVAFRISAAHLQLSRNPELYSGLLVDS